MRKGRPSGPEVLAHDPGDREEVEVGERVAASKLYGVRGRAIRGLSRPVQGAKATPEVVAYTA